MADEDIQIALDPTRDDSTGEYFNLDETGEKKGPLQRYLKTIGYVLDEAKGLLDAFPVMIDVDNTDPMFLAPMGKLVGINFNDDISTTQAREEIKKAVPWYKRKATHSGNELYGYMISRVNCLSRAFVDNVLISTRSTNSLKYTYNESVDTSDPEKRYLYDLPGDITGFSEDYVHKSYMTPREVTASSAQTGHDAVFAVDQSEQSSWKPLSSDTNNHLQFTFDDEKLPSWVRVFGGDGVRDFALEHSADGVTWYRDAEYRIGCFERYNHYLGTYVPGTTQFYTRKSLIESVPDERLYVITPSTTVFGYLTKAATAEDTIIEVSDPTLYAEGEWILLANGSYKTCVQIKEISGNRIELYGKIMMSNDFPQYNTVVYKTNAVLKYPYGYVVGTSEYSGNNLNGLTVRFNINGHITLITFSGFDDASTAYEAALYMNSFLTYGSVEVVDNKLRVVSNIIGTGSYASVVDGTALSELGLTAGTGYGSYSIDRDDGMVTIRGDQFVDDDQLAIIYTALEDSTVINQWYSFKVPQYLREPVQYWRVSVLDTWGGEKEIKEIELHGNEYYPRLYRHERIGLYLNFGNIQQTCTANVCNKPVTQETLAKLMRYSCTAIPAGYEMVLGVLDCHYGEDAYQRVNLFESYRDGYIPDIVTIDTGSVSSDYYDTIVLGEKPSTLTITHSIDDMCIVSPNPISIVGNTIIATGGFILADGAGLIDGLCMSGWSITISGITASGSGTLTYAEFNALCSAAGLTVLSSGTTLDVTQLQALGFDMVSHTPFTMYIVLKICNSGFINATFDITY